MNIFIDTAVKGCNIALFDNEKILASVQEPLERGHAEAILPLYQNLMMDIGCDVSDIENIYVTVGPGSFTGLRVGLTVARFIGFSLGKPVHGVTTFQAFSSTVKSQAKRCVLVETKRSDFYVQILDENHQPISEAQSLEANDIVQMIDGMNDIVVTGDAVERFCALNLDLKYDYEVQEMISIQSVVSLIQSNCLDKIPADAFYIRDADVSQPKAKKITSQQR